MFFRQMDHNSRILNILSDEDVKKNMFAKSLQSKCSLTNGMN